MPEVCITRLGALLLMLLRSQIALMSEQRRFGVAVMQVIVGGTSLLTPKRLLRTLRRRRPDRNRNNLLKYDPRVLLPRPQNDAEPGGQHLLQSFADHPLVASNRPRLQVR